MKNKAEGNRKVNILEDNGEWIVKTHCVHNDIIRDLDYVRFRTEKEWTNYVRNFFLCKKDDRVKDFEKSLDINNQY